MFQSFFQGGFEGSTHRRSNGQQLDSIAGSRHDVYAETDYRLLGGAGLRTVRDALRWHLIEVTPGQYDWSSFLPMLRAARAAGVEVVWDLCHYGLPHDIDLWSAAFVERFAAFAAAAARVVRTESDQAPSWCVINEISFWSWGGGDCGMLFPNTLDRGHELKRQLVRATIAATDAVRGVDPRARFIQAEPLINIAPDLYRPEDYEPAEAYRLAQFQAWDMLCGTLDPELGGRPEYLDVVGINFYWDNQWLHNKYTIGLGHRQFRPLHRMLAEVHERYRRPMIVSETGVEGDNGPGWLRYVGGEVRAALRLGLPVEGLCLYPVMDYPGWEDARHCPCGLIRLDDAYLERRVDADMALALRDEAGLLQAQLGSSSRMALAAD